jgi:hypothetical protein
MVKIDMEECTSCRNGHPENCMGIVYKDGGGMEICETKRKSQLGLLGTIAVMEEEKSRRVRKRQRLRQGG